MRGRVLLLHGIWMRGFVMTRMARRLEEDGFTTELLDVPLLGKGADVCAADLRVQIDALDDEVVHLVGHSLGGLVALLATQDWARPGRTVCLGSPLNGSAAARTVATFAPWLLGRSHDRLIRGIEEWRGPREVGVIAGRLPVGIAWLLGGLRGENDGTVTVAETRLKGIHEHAVIAATHTGLLFSDRAIALTARFLKHGRFG